MAYHDGLTDLANRTFFVEQLTRAIAMVRGMANDASPCCSSISTGSSWSTTAWDTAQATRC